MNLEAVLDAHRIAPTARLLIKVLEAKARGFNECWATTKTLVAALRSCERTFYNAMTQLQDIGVIRVVRDYSKRSRRRIILLWKQAPESPAVTAKSACDSPAEFAVRRPVPPDPPNRSLKRSSLEIESKRGTPPARNTPKTPTQTSEPPPVPEAVRDLAARVAKVAGEDPTLSARLAGLTRTWAVEWVEAAVGRLERKSEREAVTSPVGFLVRTLQGFGRDGGPPAPPPREPSLRDLVPEFEWTPELLERREQWLERIRREGQVAPQDPTKFGAYRAPEREPVKPTRVDDATRRRYMELQARMGSVPAACRVTSVQEQLKRISWL